MITLPTSNTTKGYFGMTTTIPVDTIFQVLINSSKGWDAGFMTTQPLTSTSVSYDAQLISLIYNLSSLPMASYQ